MYSMYCDEEFNVLIAGHLLDKDQAVKLPFKWIKFNKTATANQIRAEYDMVYQLHIIFPGYYDVKNYNELFLTQSDVDRHLGGSLINQPALL